MDVKSGYPWWLVSNGLSHEYPPLKDDCACEVAIIGAGITGALIANALMDVGMDIVVLDQRDVGWGSTAASTALLQYEIDIELIELEEVIGKSEALRAYQACEGAVRKLGQIASELDGVGYLDCESLYFASSPKHVKRLRAEYARRRSNGFDVQWLGEQPLHDRFELEAPAALLSRPAAQIDPYAFAHALFARKCAQGLRLFDRTRVASITCDPSHVELQTEHGPLVRARHVIVAAGYETERFLPKTVARNRSSYAFVSEPLDPFPRALNGCVGWETARPYIYWRVTDDRRLIVGGEDDPIDNALKRDLKVAAKSRKLLKRMGELFPRLSLEIGFAWGGTFAETVDGLPWFGPHSKSDPRILFAMAYGGNGITYSVIGAQILRERLLGREHEMAHLFGFDRVSR